MECRKKDVVNHSNSTRIVEGKTSKGLVLDDEVRKWKVEFWKGGGRQY